ncbi:HAMP domain-containing sensor histidine kinase [Candidatus Arthromitus sp. SFB-rat-Yit]|uniref:HAMP domain-containing sensor histidine kinase n=1 Tax=Candidatus Arthromitus sp. SFB-rat-Yit TaxID=1041504 RepID=UPI000227A1EF|nr:HAMP domain-containing sensor histidine kinase [Candidatus Arthromitus sp. SFB-rat-Yit]BAK80772.1 sensor histidine kinase [Candidatus Arthromitus sp. SFB-rat-Yit]
MKSNFIKKIFVSSSIRYSIIKSSISVFLFIILVLSLSISYYVRKAYYDTISDNLSSQIIKAVENYQSNYKNSSLETNILLDLDNFISSTSAQVQVIDLDGQVLMDTIGVTYDEPIDTYDFKTAIFGGLGQWIGKVSYSNSKVMSVSYPIENYDQVIGVLRFTVSLDYANKNITKIIFTFILAVIIALIFYIIIIGLVTEKIIQPIKTLTNIAKKMAVGDLGVRCRNLPKNEVGALGDTLNYMADEISKKDQLKNEFISTVSHELRTPLTSIKGWAITLQYDKVNDPDLLNGLKIIEGETERLSSMVEELLDFSKFISQKVTLKFEKIYIKNIHEYIINYIKPREDREKFKFIIDDIDEDIALISLNVDFNRIKQVLVNVLDNAIKFIKENGEITLRYLVDKNKNIIYLEIIDNGIGIPSEELSRVKEKFFKGKSSKSKNGLGLSISDEIMKLHGGELLIDSVYGEWTKVTLVLPME